MAESGTLYICYYGWGRMSEGFLKWIHLSMSVVLTVIGTVLMFLSAKTQDERAHYDWMGYVAMFIAVLFLIPLPFAGYWLMREVYAYRQQMGITLMGGLLAWLFIVQATMIGALFLTSSYYLWQCMGWMRGAEHYPRYVKYLVFIMTVGFLIFITPHTIVMTPAELKAMGGSSTLCSGTSVCCPRRTAESM